MVDVRRWRGVEGGRSWWKAVLEPSPSASRMRARAMHRERPPTVTHSAGSPCDRDTLHLDQHFRARQAGDGYQGARWEIVGEDLPAELGEPVAEPRIGDEHGHRHQIGKARAGFFEGPPEPGEDLADLAVEISGERAARGILDRHLSGQPDRTSAFGNARLRIGAGLRRLALDVASLQRFRHLSLHLVRQRSYAARDGQRRNFIFRERPTPRRGMAGRLRSRAEGPAPVPVPGRRPAEVAPLHPGKKLAVAMPRIAYLACVQLSHNPSTQVLEG